MGSRRPLARRVGTLGQGPAQGSIGAVLWAPRGQQGPCSSPVLLNDRPDMLGEWIRSDSATSMLSGAQGVAAPSAQDARRVWIASLIVFSASFANPASCTRMRCSMEPSSGKSTLLPSGCRPRPSTSIRPNALSAW